MIVMKIIIDNNKFIDIEAAPEDLDKLDKYFTWKDYSECYVYGKFKKENIKIRKALVRKKKYPTRALLPIGFIHDLQKWLKLHNAKYKIFDSRKDYGLFKKWESNPLTYEEIENSLGYIQLFDYQVNSIIKCFQHGQGIIKSPTGSGKTEMFISLCKLAGIPTLILFARIALAQQTYKRMKKAGVDAGIVQGKNLDENHLVVMATVQSAHKLKRTDYKMIIVDETHRAAAEKYQDILKSNIFRYRFGFSATPLSPKDTAKWNNAKVKMWLGSIIHVVHPQELIKNQRIAKPTIHIWTITKPQLDEERKWQYVENHGIVNNDYRNTIISNLTQSLDGQILVLCKRIEQGQTLEKLIPNSIFLFGDIKDNEREKVVERFNNGEKFVLIASTIFDEGISIDSVNHVVLAGGGSSFIKILQRVGRGTRIQYDDNNKIIKNSVDIHDFFDDIHHILKKHSNDRIKTYKNYGYKDIIIHNKNEIKELEK